jgi:aspartate/methionine/tyrosine aminotransferase
MEFYQIEYFEWVKRYFDKIEINLAYSGIPPVDSSLLPDISGDLENWSTLPMNFNGYPELLNVLSERYKTPENCILSASGASKANFLVMASIIKPGDLVLVETPNYEPLFRIPQMLGAKVEFIPRLAKKRYEIDMEALKEIMSKNIKMLVISNLHNPSSEALSNPTLKAMCELVEDYKCYLLSDEVYREFIFEDIPPQVCNLSENAITTNSMTKVFGLPGLRVGWVMANASIIKKCQKLKNYTSVISPPLTEKIASSVLRNGDKLIKNANSVLKQNQPIIKNWIKNQPYIDLDFPDFGAFCFPRFCNINVTELCDILINYYETLIAPGKFFGASEYARISYVMPKEQLITGLENIENAVEALTKPTEAEP